MSSATSSHGPRRNATLFCPQPVAPSGAGVSRPVLHFLPGALAQWMNGADWGKYVADVRPDLVPRRVVPVVQRGHVGESEGRQYGHKIDISFRWSMSWFIFSEVMFFGAFFTALWWATWAIPCPHLGSLENALACGQTSRPYGRPWHAGVDRRRLPNIVEPFTTMTPFWLPTINTALLSVVRRDAHDCPPCTPAWQSRQDHRLHVAHRVCWASCSFLAVQGYEYYHAYHEMNLKLTSGALWLNVLHVDRFSRLPRFCRHADVAVHHVTTAKGPLHG